ncbi:TATA box-binding protein-associated factor RNA polymerase I subunit A [Aplochiton taeniatus]
MDDLEFEIPPRELAEVESSDDEPIYGEEHNKSKLPLAARVIEKPKETGFHKTTRVCLQQIKDAMLHHRWPEAAEYMTSYPQTLEDTTGGMPQVLSEVVWRIGTDILHNHSNSKLEDYNSFYERMKHSGVKHYLMICLEHSFHLLVNGKFEDARRQLSIAESWRYGRLSAKQFQKVKLIHAYRAFLDYFIWRDKKATISSTDVSDAITHQEMSSYFRQSSVNLKEIMKSPGIWDPFILSYVDMLEYYHDNESALRVLNDYAYDSTFPPNPNAHVYLYQYLKRHDAPENELMKVLKVLHAIVPSHELMLEYCSLLLQSEQVGDLKTALDVVLHLLDHICWKSHLGLWKCLQTIIESITQTGESLDILGSMENRKDWWPAMHFTSFHARQDSVENPELVERKAFVSRVLFPSQQWAQKASVF